MNIARLIFCTLISTSMSYASLVAYYPLDTDALDASGNGHDGGVVGSVTFGQAGANASTGRSTDFSGGRIDVPYDAALNTPDFTVTLWANADVTAGGYRSPITNRDDAGGVTHGWIVYNDTNGNWNFWNGQGVPTWPQLSGGGVTVNTWTHLAISYESATSTKTIYVDGNVAGTATATFSVNGPQAEDLHIGGGGDDGTQFLFDGRIDDVGIFDNVLDQAAIQNIMANGVIPEPSAGGLLLLGLVLIGSFRKFKIA